MEAMPRPRPLYLSREVTRHGNAVWYVRRNGKRTRLRSKYGTPEFEVEYQAALAGRRKSDKGTPVDGSLAWLVARYRETTTWQRLSSATKKQRENILRQVIASAGEQPFAKITTATIAAGRDRRAGTPFQARHFLDTVRGLFRWAVDARLVKTDPTAGIRILPGPRVTVSSLGLRTTSPPTRSTGQSAHDSECGLMCCFTPACAAATPFA